MPNADSKAILITGGSGFIGTHLCRRLVGQGCRVRVLDLKGPDSAVQGVEYRQGDVRSDDQVSEAMRGVEAVYHLAARVSVPLCQSDPIGSYETNHAGTLKVLEAARRSGRPRVIFASSAAVYGDQGREGRGLGEELPTLPLSFYGAQKASAEQALRQYALHAGVPSISFRFFNVFGEGQDPASPYSGVVSVFARRALLGEPLSVYGSGNQTRDFVAVEDVAEACFRVLGLPAEKLVGQAVNLGTGGVLTVKEIAQAIRGAARSSSEIRSEPARAGDIAHSCADIRRARELLGWSPQRGLLEELAGLIPRLAPARTVS